MRIDEEAVFFEAGEKEGCRGVERRWRAEGNESLSREALKAATAGDWEEYKNLCKGTVYVTNNSRFALSWGTFE